MAVIFDLDQTLIDSSSAEKKRSAREWYSVYEMIPNLTQYEGINDIIQLLNANGIPVAIVTSSPEPYCKRVIAQWNWTIDAIVCFHCTKNRKPHPDPILLAVKRLNLESADEVVSIGDHSKDIIASKAAGVFSIGCSWGIGDDSELKAAKPDLMLENIADLRTFLIDKYKLK